MKRRILIILLALTAILACAFALAACGGNTSDNPSVGGDNPSTSEPPVTEEPHEHAYGEWTIIKYPNCTEAGERRQSCNCGTFKTEEIKPLGHDLKYSGAKEFTCTEDGWNAYEECLRENCGYTTKEVIPAHHVYKDYFCENCGRYQASIQLSEGGNFYTFTGLGDLTETDVVIPSEINGIPVTSIGESAFRYTNITSVVIPDTITVIGPEAFDHCSDLKTIVLPDTVTSIGAGAFKDCEKFEYNKRGDGKGDYIGSKTNPYLALINVDKSVESYTISADTKIIYYEAFAGCEKLTSIKIPGTVTELGVETFKDCTSLENVVLPDTGEIILDGTFMNCSSLKNIEIPSSVTSIGPSTFSGCSSLEKAIIPSSVTSIGNFAFFMCASLVEITIPETVSEIEFGAFEYCENLEKVYILANITSIDFDTFTGCPNLKEIVLPASLTHIGAGAFFSSGSNGSMQEKVYFLGTKEQWNAVTVDEQNTHISNADVYFYSAFKPNSGKYWHWDGEAPAIWNTEN